MRMGPATGGRGEGVTPGSDGLTRRSLLRRGVLAGGALAAAGLGLTDLLGDRAPAGSARALATTATGDVRGAPNILVVLVDQMRFPQWLPPGLRLDAVLPNISALRAQSVSFARHYTAANDCTPARSALLTGLYPHQTGCMITGRSTLDPAFPTYGSMLRDVGYRTVWYGKWHLTEGDHHWHRRTGRHSLEPYGFDGGTYPSPDGAPGQGLYADPGIANQFERWLAQTGEGQPWCATVSFVNPHDIAWWYRFTSQVPGESTVPSVFTDVPPNFQTPEELIAARKPALQLAFLQTAAAAFGAVPYSGPEAPQMWRGMLDLYLFLQQAVDQQVGRVLSALRSRPRMAANTIVIFTSDHGEYGASHGLRGKGGGAYEEAIRVPLFVHDPRAQLARSPQIERTQLTSSIDFAPLLLTLATGSNAWRGETSYSHLANRGDIASIAADPAAGGRRWIAHVTDEITTEFAPDLYDRRTPRHVLALRTERAKYVSYSHWPRHSLRGRGEERELYDYETASGRLELENEAGSSPIEGGLDTLLSEATASEVSEPLPARLQTAQLRGLQDYFEVVPQQLRAARSVHGAG
jgi:arylsulfatase A-like enzyme